VSATTASNGVKGNLATYKLCIDCKKLRIEKGVGISGLHIPTTYFCTSSALRRLDLVTGGLINANVARESYRLCGPEAKHFEEKK
jgi:hypothetical protein